ncbi:uncharacterized protein PSFLO_00066 [Pseudozyma flocculosa]|uniref:Secreted protein n=1 Tax=Pseudozyma flocculosa TaxID=84751 RepID=A0A5C3ESB1_9BASI|nr:uncharacterized protein PSFLO_00066 [Pseudozyma flocculosa]
MSSPDRGSLLLLLLLVFVLSCGSRSPAGKAEHMIARRPWLEQDNYRMKGMDRASKGRAHSRTIFVRIQRGDTVLRERGPTEGGMRPCREMVRATMSARGDGGPGSQGADSRRIARTPTSARGRRQ